MSPDAGCQLARSMDTGGFYRRGASSFAGPHVDMSHTYTSTPPPGQPPATSIAGGVYVCEPETQLDQLLFLRKRKN